MRKALTTTFLGVGIGIAVSCGDEEIVPPPPDPPQATTVTVQPASASLKALEDTIRFTAEVQDQYGDVMTGAAVGWSVSDSIVANVDNSGVATAKGDGAATVTATSGDASGTASLAVDREARMVEVTPSEATLALGDTIRFNARAEDANGFPIEDALFGWSSSDANVVEVDSAGLVRSLGEGEATITAVSDAASGTAAVEVSPPAGAVHVTPSEAAVVVGDSLRLSAIAIDPDGAELVGVTFVWMSSDESVVTVAADGRVRAVAKGSATVTASWGAVSGSAELRVAERSDRGALIALYRSTGGKKWNERTNWLTDAPLGDWYGVSVDRSGRVTRLNLKSNNLTGVLPPQIGLLGSLTRLDLSDNVIGGEIPPEIGQLRNLTRLLFRGTRFTGPLPPEIGQLTNMNTLGLNNNRFTGPIPPEISGLTRLTWADLSYNDLSGELPPGLALPQLERLIIQGNLLRGPIPRSFVESNLKGLSFDFPEDRNRFLCVPGTADFVAWAQRVVQNPRYCNAPDMATLRSLHELTGGTDWVNSDGWLSGPVLSRWHGVEVDSLGRVVVLDLTDNGLAGELPSQLGHLSALTRLRIGDNSLTGRLPMSLTSVALREFNYAGTELCTPMGDSFQAWLNSIETHEGTGIQCGALTDRDILALLYRATDGRNWTKRERWLTDAPLDDWYGVTVDANGRVTGLSLDQNNLRGILPAEIGQLTHLRFLHLHSNPLTGPIPPELGNLSRLEQLYLFYTTLTGTIPPELGDMSALTRLWLQRLPLTGSIPPELGNLTNLQFLALNQSNLEGPIPPELGKLTKLERLFLARNHFTGSLPPELGNLTRLQILQLHANRLSGPIPPEFGQMSSLVGVWLYENDLTGSLPQTLGDLSSVQVLNLASNDFTGTLPTSVGRLAQLTYLSLSNNRRMAGVLPRSLESLKRLNEFQLGGTELCAPAVPAFLDWLKSVPLHRVAQCAPEVGSRAYLTQTVQSLKYPVPLVANEPALLRVFVTAPVATDAKLPPIRATFYRGESEVGVVTAAQGSAAIPDDIDEGKLATSVNVLISEDLVQPGLEMVIEIDPDSTLDPGLGVQRRIPVTGRQALDVYDMPTLRLTVIPFLWTEEPDSSILDATDGLSGDDDLFWETRNLLPVGDFQVEVHDPVWSSTNNIFKLLNQVEALRVLEGKPGHYLGAMGNLAGALGVAHLPGWASVSVLGGVVVAHELGHNMYMYHAPCGGASGSDASYPVNNGGIGAWGYDFRDGGRLIPASHKDLMTYCEPVWISDYSFTRGMIHRLGQRAAIAHSTRSLLLWGRQDENGNPILEPAFVIDAPPVVPATPGDYEVTGQDHDGEVLFTVSFDMTEASDGGNPSFVFALPAQPEWADRLARITLSGPSGSVSLDGESDSAIAILRDPQTGTVRGILRDLERAAAARIGSRAGRGLEVLFSRGVPDEQAWKK